MLWGIVHTRITYCAESSTVEGGGDGLARLPLWRVLRRVERATGLRGERGVLINKMGLRA